MNSVNTPFFGSLRRKLAFIACQEKGGSRRTVGCFYFNQPFAASMVKRKNIVACAISVFGGHPSHLLCQVRAVGFLKALSFNFKNEGFTRLT